MRPCKRTSGVLLHPSSLPGPYGHGDLGPDAYRFADWLADAGQHLWQILPLSPPGSGNSPYMSLSCFAANPLLVAPVLLHQDGFLSEAELAEFAGDAPSRVHSVNFEQASHVRLQLLRCAAANFFAQSAQFIGRRREFTTWCADNSGWAMDYALYMALAHAGHGMRWRRWPQALRNREPDALVAQSEERAVEIDFWLFVQWQFDCQWQSLKRYANARDIVLIGDCPIYCSADSVDVWQHPQLFQLNATFEPLAVAGVPPDYFSESGQLWGNPLYDWPQHKADNYAWWVARMKRALSQTDVVRIDHFRALSAYWAVPADADTAIDGQWEPGPGAHFLDALNRSLDGLPIIAEDLGTITQDVTALREEFDLPGMKVLQFAFGDNADNPYLPHNLNANSIIYSGTHDNDTTLGWFTGAPDDVRGRVQVYLKTDGHEVSWDFIHAASVSVAALAIYPLQDVLALGPEARMNEPGIAEGQWGWRFDWAQFEPWHKDRLLAISTAHGRHVP